MNNIMIDIETMSSNYDAAIVSIGAAQFDIQTGNIGEKFYTNIDLQSCIDIGLSVSASTIMWWMSKEKEAQNSLINNPIRISDALHEFIIWCNAVNAIESTIWANSPSFDCVILKNAFNKCERNLPWNYWNERDVRTLISFNPDLKKSIINNLPHDALSDCLYQIKYCTAIYNSININK